MLWLRLGDFGPLPAPFCFQVRRPPCSCRKWSSAAGSRVLRPRNLVIPVEAVLALVTSLQSSLRTADRVCAAAAGEPGRELRVVKAQPGGESAHGQQDTETRRREPGPGGDGCLLVWSPVPATSVAQKTASPLASPSQASPCVAGAHYLWLRTHTPSAPGVPGTQTHSAAQRGWHPGPRQA